MPARPIVIAHRGASGYLPEHSLVAKALAVGMGADFLEQDVVATRDGELLVLHDHTLEDTTDVRTRYPGRARADGHFYCIDFTLDEIRTLTAGERRKPDINELRFSGRFKDDGGRFPVVTLREELAFIRGLSGSTGRKIGIYPEIKEPEWHRQHGIDLGLRMLEMLDEFGFREAGDLAYLQCFDSTELQRIRPLTRLPMVQLLDSGGGQPTAASLDAIRRYADAIGPSLKLVCRGGNGAKPGLSSLVMDAHRTGLTVHAYTVRSDELPAGIGSLDELLQLVLLEGQLDGVFTDFPDSVRRFIDRM